MATGGASKTAPSAEPGSNIHITESLSRILSTTHHPASGLALLQRAVAVQQGQMTAGDGGAKRLKESSQGELEPTRKSTPLPKPVSLVTAKSSQPNQPQQTNRVPMPVVHNQNGELLMLMNQTDLVRFAQESALTQMLSLAHRDPMSRTFSLLDLCLSHRQKVFGTLGRSCRIISAAILSKAYARPKTFRGRRSGSATNSAATLSTQVETSSNESAGPGQSILANMVTPISPMGMQDQDSSAGDAGLLVEGGHTGNGPPGSSSDRAMRRKSVHNEVEKRRRQKINNWIEKLSAIIPPSPTSNAEQAQSSSVCALSCKADVLQRTYDYVIQISKAHNELSNMLSVVQQDNEVLRNELAKLNASNIPAKPKPSPATNQQFELVVPVASPSSTTSNASASPTTTGDESAKDDTASAGTESPSFLVKSKPAVQKISILRPSTPPSRTGPVAIVVPPATRISLPASASRLSPVFATSLAVQQPQSRKRPLEDTVETDS